jgi:hypothetical protein
MIGYILSYNKVSHVGTIISGTKRYWYHRDRIVEGPVDPELNSSVIFEVSTKPQIPGKLQVAKNIVIEDSTAGANALADAGTPSAGQKDAPVKTENGSAL